MDKRIRRILSCALEKLDKDLVVQILKEDVFVTQVLDYNKVNSRVIVDFESKMIRDDYDEFINKSEDLYMLFEEVPIWYS